MELEILAEEQDVTRLVLRGKLDTPGVDAVETRVNASLSRGGHAIVDLSHVTFLSSLGVRMLISAAKMLDRRGSTLVLVAPQPLVEQALRHSGLADLLPVRADVAAALELLAS